MRPLKQALADHELIVLRILGEWWELDLTGADMDASVAALAARLTQIDMAQELLYLPPEEAAGLQALVGQGGRMPVAAYERQFGEVRMMGPGRLEREEPWFDPVSAAEALWYRGFLYRGFDETDEGVMEFYYLPTELYQPLSGEIAPEPIVPTAVSALATVAPPNDIQTAVTAAVDDMTTLLGQAMVTGLTHGKAWQPLLLNPDAERFSLLLTLAKELGWVQEITGGGWKPTRTAVGWLQQTRESQLQVLMEAWSSTAWNELRRTPGLRCEGDWENDPVLARTALLDSLPRHDEWLALDDLVALIKETDPDFQRPDGNYETWYIRDEASDAYVTGFQNWELVEGRLLRYLVQGPLFWLGMVELGRPGLFRLLPRTVDWLENRTPAAGEVQVPLVVQPDGLLLVPYNADRYVRFQIARISEAQPVQRDQPFPYRLTPDSLSRAKAQGIDGVRILRFLQEASGRPLPAGVKRGIERWTKSGVEGRVETAVILRVRDAAILDTLRQNPKTRDFLGESLGDLAVMVKPGQWSDLISATAQLGLMLDVGVAE